MKFNTTTLSFSSADVTVDGQPGILSHYPGKKVPTLTPILFACKMSKQTSEFYCLLYFFMYFIYCQKT